MEYSVCSETAVLPKGFAAKQMYYWSQLVLACLQMDSADIRRTAPCCFYARTVIIWRETQWQWLSDSVAAGRVVHTAWGEPDEWLRFGTTDCNTESPLVLPGPEYVLTQDARQAWRVLLIWRHLGICVYSRLTCCLMQETRFTGLRALAWYACCLVLVSEPARLLYLVESGFAVLVALLQVSWHSRD